MTAVALPIAPPAPAVEVAPLVLRGALHEGLTDDQFYAFCQDNPTLRIERAPDQTIILMPPCATDTSGKNSEVVRQLANWNYARRAGRTFELSAGFTLPDHSVRSPDAAWLSNEQLAELPETRRTTFWQLCPDFILEVKSPSDSLPTLHEKMRAWIANGVRLAFLLNPTTETAWVYRADGTVVEVHGFDQTLSGEDVLPGFTLELAELRA